MMRMRHCDRERIGGIVRLRIGLGQEHLDHHADLHLLAVAGPNDRLLHQVGRIFGNRKPGKRRHQHCDTARLAELEGRSGVAVDEGRLDRRLIRRMLGHHLPQTVVDADEARGKCRLVVAGDRAAGQERQPRALDRHHPPAGAAKPGIDAKDANRSRAHAPCVSLFGWQRLAIPWPRWTRGWIAHSLPALMLHHTMSPISGRIRDELVRAYSAPDRHYHNLAHIEAMLDLMRAHERALSDPTSVEAAIWFHDA